MMEWDDFDTETGEVSPELTKMSNEALAEEYAKYKNIEKFSKERCKHISVILSAQVNEEPGQYVLDGGKFDIEITRNEKFEWDSEKLADQYTRPVKAIEEFGIDVARVVKFGYAVDTAKYKKMGDGSAKAALTAALTRKPGSVSIKVTLKGDKGNETETA